MHYEIPNTNICHYYFSYHSAPESHDDEHLYEQTNHQYLELIEISQEPHYSDIKEDESDFRRSGSNDGDDGYEEID